MGLAPLLWIRLVMRLIIRVFNAQGRNLDFLSVHIFSMVTVVVLGIILTQIYGVIGVAIAASVGEFLMIVGMLFVLDRSVIKVSIPTIITWGILTAIAVSAIRILPHPSDNMLHILTSAGYILLGWLMAGITIPSGKRSMSLLTLAVKRSMNR